MWFFNFQNFYDHLQLKVCSHNRSELTLRQSLAADRLKSDVLNPRSRWRIITVVVVVRRHWIIHLGVSKNRGTPKSSILIRFSVINNPWGKTPLFLVQHPFWGNQTIQIYGNSWGISLITILIHGSSRAFGKVGASFRPGTVRPRRLPSLQLNTSTDLRKACQVIRIEELARILGFEMSMDLFGDDMLNAKNAARGQDHQLLSWSPMLSITWRGQERWVASLLWRGCRQIRSTPTTAPYRISLRSALNSLWSLAPLVIGNIMIPYKVDVPEFVVGGGCSRWWLGGWWWVATQRFFTQLNTPEICGEMIHEFDWRIFFPIAWFNDSTI